MQAASCLDPASWQPHVSPPGLGMPHSLCVYVFYDILLLPSSLPLAFLFASCYLITFRLCDLSQTGVLMISFLLLISFLIPMFPFMLPHMVPLSYLVVRRTLSIFGSRHFAALVYYCRQSGIVPHS